MATNHLSFNILYITYLQAWLCTISKGWAFSFIWSQSSRTGDYPHERIHGKVFFFYATMQSSQEGAESQSNVMRAKEGPTQYSYSVPNKGFGKYSNITWWDRGVPITIEEFLGSTQTVPHLKVQIRISSSMSTQLAHAKSAVIIQAETTTEYCLYVCASLLCIYSLI